MRKTLLRFGVVATTSVALISAGPAAVAKPAPPTVSSYVELTTDELGNDVVVAYYTFTGFQGRVVAHTALLQNGVVVLEMSGLGFGRAGDLNVMVPVRPTAGTTTNTFHATGYLTTTRGKAVPGSSTTSVALSWAVEAVPCDT